MRCLGLALAVCPDIHCHQCLQGILYQIHRQLRPVTDPDASLGQAYTRWQNNEPGILPTYGTFALFRSGTPPYIHMPAGHPLHKPKHSIFWHFTATGRSNICHFVPKMGLFLQVQHGGKIHVLATQFPQCAWQMRRCCSQRQHSDFPDNAIHPMSEGAHHAGGGLCGLAGGSS